MGIIAKLNTHGIASTAYGTCNTAINATPKDIRIVGWDTSITNATLPTGITIFVKFTNGNGVNTDNKFGIKIGNPTDGTWVTGDVISHESDDLYIAPASVVSMTYDGTNWILNDRLRQHNADFGTGVTQCYTEKNTLAKTAQLLDYNLEKGGLVAVKFSYDVPASSTLNINSQGAVPIYYKGSAITDDVINAKDTALFIYDTFTPGNYYYNLLSVNTEPKNLKDGSARGSVRGVRTSEEDNDYTMGTSAFAEGSNTKASGQASHAEGSATTASGQFAHAEGFSSSATGGGGSHAEGHVSTASGYAAHAQNESTIASKRGQTVIGTYNVEDTTPQTAVHTGGTTYGNYALICGNGVSGARSNAFTIDWNGNYVGGKFNGYTIAAAAAKSVDTSITSGSSSANLPTSAAVANFVASQISGAAVFKGTVNTGTDISGLTAYTAGWYWVVQTAGTYAGVACVAGDMIFCISDYSGSYSASDFEVVSGGLDISPMTNNDIDAILAD